MLARRTDQPHRAATPLELFFDLCFVVAVAQAAARLHEGLAGNHVGHSVVGYLTVFFAIWWAWMNFTWFASAYDTDDHLYRLTTLVQIAGILVLAAGVSRAFDGDFLIITYAYVVIRLSMVAQWLRAAAGDRDRRRTALRFASGIAAVQVGWVVRTLLPGRFAAPTFLLLVAAELLVPVIAERAAPTTWHPGHIAERYGLFTIIVLGESVLAATNAAGVAVTAGNHGPALLSLAGAGLVIVFAMWWLYFDQPAEDVLTSFRAGFLWGYGHYLVFACAAAVGAGLAVAVDRAAGHGAAPALVVHLAVGLPVAGYLLVVWLLQVCPRQRGLIAAAFPAVAVAVLAGAFAPFSVYLTALLLAALVAVNAAARPRVRAG
jgi:low temperature requirement protein LtrA